jgi:hypothetical protein
MGKKELTKRAYIVILVVCLAGMAGVVLAIAWNSLRIERANLNDYEKTESMQFSVGEVSHTGNLLQISDAWIFEPGQNVGTFNVHLALYREDSGELYVLPSQYVEREDIAEQWNTEGYDYSKSGVYSLCFLPLMRYTPDATYDILFLVENDGAKKYVDTGAVLE